MQGLWHWQSTLWTLSKFVKLCQTLSSIWPTFKQHLVNIWSTLGCHLTSFDVKWHHLMSLTHFWWGLPRAEAGRAMRREHDDFAYGPPRCGQVGATDMDILLNKVPSRCVSFVITTSCRSEVRRRMNQWTEFHRNSERLVFGCIDADLCN